MKYILLILAFLMVGCSTRKVVHQQVSQDQVIESMTTTDDYVSLYGGFGYGYMYHPWGLYNNGFYTHSYYPHYTTPIVIDRSRHYYSSSRNQTGIQRNNNYSGKRNSTQTGRINSKEKKNNYQTQKSSNYYKYEKSNNNSNNKSGSRTGTTTSPSKNNSPSKTSSSPSRTTTKSGKR